MAEEGDTSRSIEQDGQGSNRYIIQSVARALHLIDLVGGGPPEGLSLGDIARALGVSKSTAFSLARTLTNFGYLRDTMPGPRYKLGMALVRLGDLVGQQLALGDLCRPVLRELTDVTGLTSRVALSDGGYPIFIDRVDGPGTVRFYTPLGRRELPHATAAGKSILASLAEPEVRRICAETGLPRRTAHTITDVDTLLDHLVIVRRRGFAVDDEEDAEGVFCVGAAFFDHNATCVGAVSVTGIKVDLPDWRIDEIGHTVRRHADRVSGLLGGAPYERISQAPSH